MSASLFAYGSLMFPQVWKHLIGRDESPVSALLHGYLAHEIAGRTYPGLIEADRESTTAGVLYRELTSREFETLDDFEGEFYRRISVEVCLADGSREFAQTYLLVPGYRAELSPNLWNAERFRRHELQGFLAEYGGFAGNRAEPPSAR